jgi:hypothetical protein
LIGECHQTIVRWALSSITYQDLLITPGIPGVEGDTEGIIIDNLPGPESGAEGIIIINTVPGPDGSTGIIIINNMPGPDSSGEGIIIINNKEGNQVAGIGIDWGVPPDDNKVSIIIDNLPASAAANMGINWNAIVWSNSPETEEGAASIVIQNQPTGFDFEFGMTAFMDQGGFGSLPMLLGTIYLNTVGIPSLIDPDQEYCAQINLEALSSSGSSGSGFPANSFFDVFTDLTVGLPQVSDSSNLITEIVSIPPLPNLQCTPDPTIQVPGEQPTLTPTPRLPDPTPTTRTGLPTITSTLGRPAPTQTPTPKSNRDS